MLIHKDALVVSDVCTQDETTARYFLNAALFDKQGRAVATNGHVLVRFTSKPLDPDDFPKIDGQPDLTPSADVVLSAAALKAARATMATRSHLAPQNYLAIVPNGAHVTLVTSDPEHQVQIRARNIEGTFPAYEQVLDVGTPVVATVVLGPELLELIARVARKTGVKALTFTLQGSDPSKDLMDQVLFKGEGDHGTLDGAIMPMRA